MASRIVDLPEPFGPMMPVSPLLELRACCRRAGGSSDEARAGTVSRGLRLVARRAPTCRARPRAGSASPSVHQRGHDRCRSSARGCAAPRAACRRATAGAPGAAAPGRGVRTTLGPPRVELEVQRAPLVFAHRAGDRARARRGAGRRARRAAPPCHRCRRRGTCSTAAAMAASRSAAESAARRRSVGRSMIWRVTGSGGTVCLPVARSRSIEPLAGQLGWPSPRRSRPSISCSCNRASRSSTRWAATLRYTW